MGCKPIVMDGAVVGHVCGTTLTHKSIRKRHRKKFCFECRKKLPHMLTMAYDPNPSYYEPIVYWKCSGCGKDNTLFPGRGYE